MKLDVVKVCAGLIVILALLMYSSVATETTWRHSGFELWGYDINFTSHNASNILNLDASDISVTNITVSNVNNMIYADQYATIQAAIDECDGLTKCDIYIPPGTYNTDTINITKSNIYLHGAGNQSFLKLNSGNTLGIIYIDATAGNLKDISITDLGFDGNQTGTLDTHGISTRHLGSVYGLYTNINVERVTIKDTDGVGVLFYSVDYGRVRDCKFTNTSYQAFYTHSSRNIIISGNDIEGTYLNTGIGIDVGNKRTIITENHINNTKLGSIYVAPADSVILHDLVISNNIITNSQQQGLYLQRIYNATITGNIIKTCGAQGIYANYVNNSIISGNIIDDTVGAAYQAATATATVINNYGVNPYDFGNKATAPTPYGAGDEYYNSTANIKYCYNGSAWHALY